MLDSGLILPTVVSGGIDRDVVVSCAARLGRNLEDALFPNRSSITEAHETRDRLLASIARVFPDRIEVPVEGMEASEALLLAERGWAESAAPNEPGRALAVLDAGATVLAVNDVDHLRITATVSGADCLAALSRAREIDEALDGELVWAATAELGYLSAKIDEGGSALRLSAVVFIPGILAAGVLDRVVRGLISSGIEPRVVSSEADAEPGETADIVGIPAGAAASPYMELCSHAVRGVTEENFAKGFGAALSGLVDGERKTRERLLGSRRVELEDAAWRAAATLGGARLLGEAEARRLLADLRAGIAYGLAPEASPGQEDPYAGADRARSVVGAGHLRALARHRGLAAGAPSLEALRAQLVRDVLPRYHIT